MNKAAHVENEYVDAAGGGEGGTNWESSIDIYTLPVQNSYILIHRHIYTNMCKIGSYHVGKRQLLHSTGCSTCCCHDLDEWAPGGREEI